MAATVWVAYHYIIISASGLMIDWYMAHDGKVCLAVPSSLKVLDADDPATIDETGDIHEQQRPLNIDEE